MSEKYMPPRAELENRNQKRDRYVACSVEYQIAVAALKWWWNTRVTIDRVASEGWRLVVPFS